MNIIRIKRRRKEEYALKKSTESPAKLKKDDLEKAEHGLGAAYRKHSRL